VQYAPGDRRARLAPHLHPRSPERLQHLQRGRVRRQWHPKRTQPTRRGCR
jgi:hypothetical protein